MEALTKKQVFDELGSIDLETCREKLLEMTLDYMRVSDTEAERDYAEGVFIQLNGMLEKIEALPE